MAGIGLVSEHGDQKLDGLIYFGQECSGHLLGAVPSETLKDCHANLGFGKASCGTC